MNATVRDVMTATDEVGQEIVDAVSHVQGVVRVRDRLEYAGDRLGLPASS